MQLEWEKGVLKRLCRVDLQWTRLGRVEFELQPLRCILSFHEAPGDSLPIAVTIAQQHPSPWVVTEHLLELLDLAGQGSVIANDLAVVRSHVIIARCFGLLRSFGAQRQARGERVKLQQEIANKHKAMTEAAELEDFLLAHNLKEQRNALREKEHSSRNRDYRKRLGRPEEDPLPHLEAATKLLTQTMDRLEALHAQEAVDKIKSSIEKLKEFARIQEVTLFAKAPLPAGPPPTAGASKPPPPPPAQTRENPARAEALSRAVVVEAPRAGKPATHHPAPIVERLDPEAAN